ncbi:alkaline ceramidase ydc1 [Oleoguttula sp. CCFEE 5521]
MAFSIPYRDQPYTPIVGPPTAPINFCEEDFAISPYIGEVVNTLTNIAYIVYATKGLRRLPRNAHFAARSLYYGLALVGTCSALFHGLLKHYAQLADDTSMIIATSCVLHRATVYGRSDVFTRTFSTLLLTSVVAETIYHVLYDANNKFHEISFLVLLLLVIWRTRKLITSRVPQSADRRLLTSVTIFGTSVFGVAYTLWQLDQIYCSQLTSWKRSIGMPWSFLLEFHGWWHILTAIAAYVFMVMVGDLTSEGDVEFHGSVYSWLGVRSRHAHSNDGLNGHANRHANGKVNGHANGSAMNGGHGMKAS